MYTIKRKNNGKIAIFKVEFTWSGNKLVDMGQQFNTMAQASEVLKTYDRPNDTRVNDIVDQLNDLLIELDDMVESGGVSTVGGCNRLNSAKMILDDIIEANIMRNLPF